jgi:hypothetical protein
MTGGAVRTVSCDESSKYCAAPSDRVCDQSVRFSTSGHLGDSRFRRQILRFSCLSDITAELTPKKPKISYRLSPFRGCSIVVRASPWRPISERRAVDSCGDLHFGFARSPCPDCRYEMFVAFSCQQRCLCPSCHQKRTLLAAAEQTTVEATEDAQTLGNGEDELPVALADVSSGCVLVNSRQPLDG